MYDTNLKRKWDNQAALDYARYEGEEAGMEEGMKRGMEKGIEKGIEKGKTAIVANLITKLGFEDEQAAAIAEVSIEFVRKVRAELKKDR